MNLHKNAHLTPSGRALLADRVASGGTVKAGAGAAGVSRRTGHKWPARHRLGGERRHHAMIRSSSLRLGVGPDGLCTLPILASIWTGASGPAPRSSWVWR
ncbi:MAG: hypothetical protein IM626_05570 [Phenylobacterium sp.]|nr:hypothetical protein [Phenylobacterium sp.]MCA6287805.1 hypothetical protein [Phenylobacterium sp.]MCA6309407.1 hypothetical protein [Phenylobacterium sp.]MCA6323192.1 hypothetical protein [Phenylobacterium sp.]MCA6337384.1 hypothetical protein [Phenylobacterium sp.]